MVFFIVAGRKSPVRVSGNAVTRDRFSSMVTVNDEILTETVMSDMSVMLIGTVCSYFVQYGLYGQTTDSS